MGIDSLYKNDNERLESKNEKNNEQLDKKFDTPDNVSDGVDLMVKKEIASAQEEINKLGLSPEELKNGDYTGKFTTVHKEFTKKTQEILNGPGKPEEKTKALEIAYENFQEKIGEIKGQKEGMDSKRGIEQGKNIQEQDSKNEKGSQKFKDALLESIQKISEERALELRREARRGGDKESATSATDAPGELFSGLENAGLPNSPSAQA